MTFRKYIQLITAGCLLCLAVGSANAKSKSFDVWLADFRTEAARGGISESTLNAALDGLVLNDEVVNLDRKQPESTKSFEQYMSGALSKRRKERAAEEFSANRSMLEKIGAQYGVQPEYIVALWGIESNFGENTGNFAVVESLATLAYDGRRSDYFRGELLRSLQIIDEGHISFDAMSGSWAGAMGQCQFMPTSFFNYAVDADGDGRKDIWNDTQDVFASIANYLSSNHWDLEASWGSPVNISSKTYQKLRHKKGTLSQWGAWGVEPTHTNAGLGNYSLLSGNQNGRGPYFLVGANYENILKWNRSRYFALAVGTLADSISRGASD